MTDHDCEHYINSINELICFAMKTKDKLIFDRKINDNVKTLTKFAEKIKNDDSVKRCRKELKKKRVESSSSSSEDEKNSVVMDLENNNTEIICFMNEVIKQHKKINNMFYA